MIFGCNWRCMLASRHAQFRQSYPYWLARMVALARAAVAIVGLRLAGLAGAPDSQAQVGFERGRPCAFGAGVPRLLARSRRLERSKRHWRTLPSAERSDCSRSPQSLNPTTRRNGSHPRACLTPTCSWQSTCASSRASGCNSFFATARLIPALLAACAEDRDARAVAQCSAAPLVRCG